MGCDLLVFKFSSVKRPRICPPKSRVNDIGKSDSNVYMFTPDDDYSQVVVHAELHGSAQQRRIAFQENDFLASNSLRCPLLLIRSRSTSKRPRSLDFLEYVIPSKDIAELGRKIGSLSFWKTLQFWQRPRKNAVGCFSVTQSPQHPDHRQPGRKHKTTRASIRDVLGPIYLTDCNTILYRHGSTQQIPCPIIIAPLSSKSDGTLCPYMPLNRPQRIPSGPLYRP